MKKKPRVTIKWKKVWKEWKNHRYRSGMCPFCPKYQQPALQEIVRKNVVIR